MRPMDMTDALWAALLALRNGAPDAPPDHGMAGWRIYAPLATPGRYVVAQVGQSLDGRVATPAGDACDVSGADGLRHLHRLRAMADAVIVGVGTVIADGPRLSVRYVAGPSPVRVVIDAAARMPSDAQMLSDGGRPVIVLRADDAPERPLPAEVIRLPRGPNGIDPHAILTVLADRGLTRILVEGGARTIARFIQARALDRLHVAVSPIIIGSGPAGLTLPPIERLSSACRPQIDTYDLGSDTLFDCGFR